MKRLTPLFVPLNTNRTLPRIPDYKSEFKTQFALPPDQRGSLAEGRRAKAGVSSLLGIYQAMIKRYLLPKINIIPLSTTFQCMDHSESDGEAIGPISKFTK